MGSPRQTLLTSAQLLEDAATNIRAAAHVEEITECVNAVDAQVLLLQEATSTLATFAGAKNGLPRRTFDISKYMPIDYHQFATLDEFLAVPVRDGISEIQIGAVPLHLLFLNRGADTTLVHFAAALPATGHDTYPNFAGRPTAARIPTNHLSISDPNYALGGCPTTGWFCGSEDQSLQLVLARIISHATEAGVKDQAILFGSSAGGFAALFYGAKLPGSVTVCANPRVDLTRKPTHFFEYQYTAFPRTPLVRLKSRVVTNAAGYHTGGAGNTVAYIQNIQDTPYFEGNMIPFLEKAAGSAKVWLNLIDSGPKHVLPGGTVIADLLAALVTEAPDWAEALRQLEYKQHPSPEYALQRREAMLSGTGGQS